MATEAVTLQPNDVNNTPLDESITNAVEREIMIGGEKSMLDPTDEVKAVEAMLESLTEEEKGLLPDPGMPVRHFRAEKGVLPKAIASLKGALKWRQDFELQKIMDCFQNADGDKSFREIIAFENSPGKIYVRGYDKDGRSFVYMKPAKENSNNELNNMRHLCFNLKKSFACTAKKSAELGSNPPLEKINILIDYKDFSLTKAPPLSTARFTLDILQKYLCERVHRYYLINPPIVFRVFWNIVKPFVSAATKESIIFCTGKTGLQKIRDVVTDESMLEECAGGTSQVREFDSEEYLNLPFDQSFDEK